MKKVIMGTLVIGVLLVSLASAGLVDFLSNVVSGSVSVEGPVFYLDKEDIMDSNSFSLKMNDDDIDDDGMFTLGNSYKLREFISESLGIDDFYEHDFLVTLDVEAVDYDENSTGALQVVIDIVREDGSPRNIELCNIGLLGIEERRDDYEILCETNSHDMSDMNPTDRLRLSLRDWSSSVITEKIYIYGDSRIQVVAKDE